MCCDAGSAFSLALPTVGEVYLSEVRFERLCCGLACASREDVRVCEAIVITLQSWLRRDANRVAVWLVAVLRCARCRSRS